MAFDPEVPRPLMASTGIERFAIGRVLNHVEPGVTKVYDIHSEGHAGRGLGATASNDAAPARGG